MENLIRMIIDKQANQCHLFEMEVGGCPFFTSGAQAGAGDSKIRAAAQEMEGHIHKYSVALIRGLKADGLLDGDPDIDQTARLLHHMIQGALMYGRVMNSLDAVRADLRAGIYRVICLKDEYRIEGPETVVSATANAA